MLITKHKLEPKTSQERFSTSIKYTLPIILWVSIIFFLCVLRPENLPTNLSIPGLDKLAHAFFYAILIFLLLRRFSLGKNKEHIGNAIVIWSFCISIGYGGIIELIQEQYFVYRSAEWLDMVANMAGSLIGIIAFKFIIRQSSI